VDAENRVDSGLTTLRAPGEVCEDNAMARTSPAPVSRGKIKKTKKPMSPRTAQLIAIAVVVAFIVAIVAILISSTQTSDDTTGLPDVDTTVSAQVQRDDSHAISDPANPEVTIVEFLDFQCPACAVASGVIAEIKA
jgi:protein-disulfide isomerase